MEKAWLRPKRGLERSRERADSMEKKHAGIARMPGA